MISRQRLTVCFRKISFNSINEKRFKLSSRLCFISNLIMNDITSKKVDYFNPFGGTEDPETIYILIMF